MDPDDRLIEELGGELRRSLAEMRLHSEFREELKHRMLATPPRRWRRWLGAWPPIAQHRGALVGVAVAAIALAVVLPLAASQNNQAPRGRQYLVMIPPPVNGGGAHAAEVAPVIPASCGAAAIQLTVTPAQATLRPGQSARFTVSETGVACPPAATITGPSAAGLSIAAVPQPPSSGNSAPVKGSYEVTWTGKSIGVLRGTKLATPAASRTAARLSAGAYEVILRVPHSSARVSIEITISK